MFLPVTEREKMLWHAWRQATSGDLRCASPANYSVWLDGYEIAINKTRAEVIGWCDAFLFIGNNSRGDSLRKVEARCGSFVCYPEALYGELRE